MISLSIRASPPLGHTTAVGRALDTLETGDTPWADHRGRRYLRQRDNNPDVGRRRARTVRDHRTVCPVRATCAGLALRGGLVVPRRPWRRIPSSRGSHNDCRAAVGRLRRPTGDCVNHDLTGSRVAAVGEYSAIEWSRVGTRVPSATSTVSLRNREDEGRVPRISGGPQRVRVCRSASSSSRTASSSTRTPCSARAAARAGSHGVAAGEPVRPGASATVTTAAR